MCFTNSNSVVRVLCTLMVYVVVYFDFPVNSPKDSSVQSSIIDPLRSKVDAVDVNFLKKFLPISALHFFAVNKF